MEFGEKIKPISNKRTLKLHEATELQNLADEKWLYCFSKQVSEVKKKKEMPLERHLVKESLLPALLIAVLFLPHPWEKCLALSSIQ